MGSGICDAIKAGMAALTWNPSLSWGQLGLAWGGLEPVSGRKVRMASVNPNQCIGFLTQVADYFEQYKPALIAKNYDPTNDITALRSSATILSQLDTEQEGIKTALSNKTDQVNGQCNSGYATASNRLDMAIGAFGKSSAEGKEGTRIRKSLRGRPSTNGLPTPAPIP